MFRLDKPERPERKVCLFNGNPVNGTRKGVVQDILNVVTPGTRFSGFVPVFLRPDPSVVCCDNDGAGPAWGDASLISETIWEPYRSDW